jgi:Fic family protein
LLRYKEKEDFESRFSAVDEIAERWRERTTEISDQLKTEFESRLLISLVYHDAALEGEVLTYSEINAATDKNIISDESLIPSYESIKNFHGGCLLARELAGSKKKLKIDVVRELYKVLSPDESAKGAPYRKENPLHRLYYHDIAPPEKIAYRMRKFSDWLDSADAKELHPIDRAARAHWELMAIFPWVKETGRLARIMSNLILEQSGYPLAVIHSTDRQRYYEALKTDTRSLLSIYLEAVEITASSALQVYDAAEPPARRRAS